MKRRAMMLMALVAVAGCRTPWVNGEVSPRMPRYEAKCPADAAFFVDKTEKRVKSALESALRRRGFEVAATEEESDMLLKVSVDEWEFNDAGFSGFGARDDMSLTVTLMDRRRKSVLGRWGVTVKSDFRVFDKLVGKF